MTEHREAISTSGSKWLLLFGVWLLYASFGLTATSLAPITSLLIEDLAISHGEMGLAMGAWQLVYIFAAVPAGILLDRLGTKYALSVGGLFICSSALARVFATDATTLILAVMLFGLGGPVISAGAPKVVISSFTGASRGLAMGIYTTGPAIGGIISLTITHSVLLPMFDHSWRLVLSLWSAIAFAAAAIWFVIGSVVQTASRNEAPSDRVPQLHIIRKLLTEPSVSIILCMGIFVFMFNHGLNNWLPELLQHYGLSATNAGFWAAIPTVIGLIGALIIPRLATPERRFRLLLGLSAMAFLASLLLQFSQSGSLLSGLLLQGIARSSLMTILILALVELPEIGERYAGVASGLFFSAGEIGGMLGPLMLGLLYAPGAGFSFGLWLLTVLASAMIFGSVLLQRRAHHRIAAPGRQT